MSAGPAVVGTPHGPSWHSQMPLVVNFRVKKIKSWVWVNTGIVLEQIPVI